MANNEFVKEIADKKYEYGFTTDIHTEIIEQGLNEDIIRLISAKKQEPEWLLDFRLKAALAYARTARLGTCGAARN